jgi:hypothetical protein
MNFKEFRVSLSESVVKSYKLGKYKAEIKKEGDKYVAYLDSDKLDEFKSTKDAQTGLKDFVDLLDKK